MQLSRIYSNLNNLFTPIDFNDSSDETTLNVVFADIKKKKAKDGDSHNLGKTTLIALIDFLLLKSMTNSDNFLATHKTRFEEFVFYIELNLHSGGYVTGRRSVAEPEFVGILRSERLVADATAFTTDEWTHWNVGLSSAQETLDSYLDLTAIKPWDYRHGVSYFLRTQSDYSNYFQIQKFMRGQDRYWKPYLAALLGIDYEAVKSKYLLEDQIGELELKHEQRKSEISAENHDRGGLVTRIEIQNDEVSQLESQLDQFDFYEVETQINKTVVDKVERQISELNIILYDLKHDIVDLERSLGSGIKFDLQRIKQIFHECKVNLPDALIKSYDDLVTFNKRLTTERNKALRAQLAGLQAVVETKTQEHSQLNAERKRLLEMVQYADTFKKYKALQREQAQKKAELVILSQQLSKLDDLVQIDGQLRELKAERERATTSIEKSLSSSNTIQRNVTVYFHRFTKQVLEHNGEFVVRINSKGNLDFEISVKDSAGVPVSKDRGHSYRRLLCVLFDLAVLKSLEDNAFYHFVYHDGLLEGLDNRIKLRLLELVREITSNRKIQYILSVIDTDLPRDAETGEQIRFAEEEIVVRLHDQGDDGSLFKMAPF